MKFTFPSVHLCRAMELIRRTGLRYLSRGPDFSLRGREILSLSPGLAKGSVHSSETQRQKEAQVTLSSGVLPGFREQGSYLQIGACQRIGSVGAGRWNF